MIGQIGGFGKKGNPLVFFIEQEEKESKIIEKPTFLTNCKKDDKIFALKEYDFVSYIVRFETETDLAFGILVQPKKTYIPQTNKGLYRVHAKPENIDLKKAMDAVDKTYLKIKQKISSDEDKEFTLSLNFIKKCAIMNDYTNIFAITEAQRRFISDLFIKYKDFSEMPEMVLKIKEVESIARKKYVMNTPLSELVNAYSKN